MTYLSRYLFRFQAITWVPFRIESFEQRYTEQNIAKGFIVGSYAYGISVIPCSRFDNRWLGGPGCGRGDNPAVTLHDGPDPEHVSLHVTQLGVGTKGEIKLAFREKSAVGAER